MNDNLEKELNEIESVEKQNQEHLKNIDSKVDELNELVNNINEKSVVTNKNVGNVIANSNNTIQIQPQKEKILVDVKKEIFNYRKLVRWTSFLSIFSIILIGFFVLLLYLCGNYSLVYNSFHYNCISGSYSLINKSVVLDRYRLSILQLIFLCSGLLLVVINWILNIKLLIKLKKTRKLYLPFFIFSFVIPFLTWLYCMGLIAFMKHKNKINYFNWLKEFNFDKYNQKIKNKELLIMKKLEKKQKKLNKHNI